MNWTSRPVAKYPISFARSSNSHRDPEVWEVGCTVSRVPRQEEITTRSLQKMQSSEKGSGMVSHCQFWCEIGRGTCNGMLPHANWAWKGDGLMKTNPVLQVAIPGCSTLGDFCGGIYKKEIFVRKKTEAVTELWLRGTLLRVAFGIFQRNWPGSSHSSTSFRNEYFKYLATFFYVVLCYGCWYLHRYACKLVRYIPQRFHYLVREWPYAHMSSERKVC